MSTQPPTADAPSPPETIDGSDPDALRITTRQGRTFAVPRRRPPESALPPAPPIDLGALLPQFSASARRALAIADAFRRDRGRPAVDVEHLLAGLLAVEGGVARQAFETAEVGFSEFEARLLALGLDAPKVNVVRGGRRIAFALPLDARLDGVPPISDDVRRALAGADQSARYNREGAREAELVIHARYLLTGITTLVGLPVVQLFADVWPHAMSIIERIERKPGGAIAGTDEVDADNDEHYRDLHGVGAEAGAPPPPTPLELSREQLADLLGSLSISARKAVGVADAFRRERGQDAVHMEHLLAGIYVEHGGHQWYAFDAAELPPERLAALLGAFELRVRTGPPGGNSGTRLVAPRGDDVDRMPPLSGHARRALTAAALAAGWTPGSTPAPGLIQARHLLTGFLAVRQCSVVAALDPVRRGLVAALHQRIDQDAAAGDVSAEQAREQHRRLAAILDAPAAPADEAGEATEPAPAAEPATKDATDAATAAAALVGTGRGGTNDRAEGEDQLGFAYYVSAFAELIDSPDTRPPLTIGIFGSWGAGKSFLLTKLKETVRRRSARLRPSELRESGRELRRLLLRRPPPTRERAFVYCVDFNAWEYNAAERIWPRLIRRVLDGVDGAVRLRERPFRWVVTRGGRLGRNVWRLARDGWKELVAWAVVAALLGALATWDVPGPRTSLFEFVVGQPIDDKLNLSLLLGALAGFAKLLKDALLAPMERWVRAMLADGRGYGLESDAMAAVRRDLELLDRRLAAERSRVLIVIDDLDRCEPDKAVEMLQAINLLLDRPSFIICLGIDARVVTAAVERHYRELLGPAGITGYEYLDKIVQIPFSIPEPSPDDLADFVSRQMGRGAVSGGAESPTGGAAPDGSGPGPAATPATPATTPSTMPSTAPGAEPAEPAAGAPLTADAAERLRDAERLIETTLAVTRTVTPIPGALLTRVSSDLLAGVLDPEAEVPESLSFTDAEERAFRAVTPYLRRNPRHVKRLVNVYALVRSLAAMRGERRILDDPGATVRWLTLCGQWPYATRELLRAAAELERTGGAPADGAPPLAQLLARVAPGLDPARRQRFDHAPELLAELVRTSGDLSWDELLVLRRYTLNFNPALESELRVADARRATLEG